MKPELSEGQLIDILRDKDKQIVELESTLREKDKENEVLNERIGRVERDLAAYLQLIEVKDDSIVKLSNKVDELELTVKMDQASPPCSAGLGPFHYVEKVSVPTQTDSDKVSQYFPRFSKFGI